MCALVPLARLSFGRSAIASTTAGSRRSCASSKSNLAAGSATFSGSDFESPSTDRASTPVDPLYLHAEAGVSGAAHRSGTNCALRSVLIQMTRRPGWVRVRFSELPVHEWHKLSNDEKRRIGISKGAGVSIVRAGREVDYGWFFMGSKHRENYDDWWRCEIQFDPVLDEAFGITHTKQQARPQAHLSRRSRQTWKRPREPSTVGRVRLTWP